MLCREHFRRRLVSHWLCHVFFHISPFVFGQSDTIYSSMNSFSLATFVRLRSQALKCRSAFWRDLLRFGLGHRGRSGFGFEVGFRFRLRWVYRESRQAGIGIANGDEWKCNTIEENAQFYCSFEGVLSTCRETCEFCA